MADKAAWQREFDQGYPHGAICSWDRPRDPQPVIYRAARFQVVGMAGLDPVVVLLLLEKSRVLGPERVTSYAPARAGHWPPGTHCVTFGTAADPMFWSPQVPGALHGPMARAREQYISQAGAYDQGPGLRHEVGPDGGVPPPREEGAGP